MEKELKDLAKDIKTIREHIQKYGGRFHATKENGKIKCSTSLDKDSIHVSFRGSEDVFEYEGSYEGFMKNYAEFCKKKNNENDDDFFKKFKTLVFQKLKDLYGDADTLKKMTEISSKGFCKDLNWACAIAMEELRNYSGHIRKCRDKYYILYDGDVMYSNNELDCIFLPMFRTNKDAAIAASLMKPFLKKSYGK